MKPEVPGKPGGYAPGTWTKYHLAGLCWEKAGLTGHACTKVQTIPSCRLKVFTPATEPNDFLHTANICNAAQFMRILSGVTLDVSF